MTEVLGAPDAVEHCDTLAAWHWHRAQVWLTLTAWMLSVLVLATGGLVVLSAMRVWLGVPLR